MFAGIPIAKLREGRASLLISKKHFGAIPATSIVFNEYLDEYSNEVSWVKTLEAFQVAAFAKVLHQEHIR